MPVTFNLHFCCIGKFLEDGMCPKWLLLFLIMPILWIQTGGGAWAQVEKHTAFVNVNLVPMTDEIIIPEQTVLVKGKRITALGPSKAMDLPEDSIVINGTNFYLMPGLADVHTHTDTNWLNGPL